MPLAENSDSEITGRFAYSILILVAFVVCASVASAIVLGDTLTGEVRGTVLDAAGKVPLPEASITLINVARGWKRQVQTAAEGSYVFIQLEPGNYTLAAEKIGYYRNEKADILVRLNQTMVVIPPIELRQIVSTPVRQITVQGEQPKIAIIDLTAPGPNPSILAYLREPGMTSLVSLRDWALRSNYDAQDISALPLRGGRSFDQLSLLSPGVSRAPFAAGEGPAVGIGVGTPGQFSVNGLRSRSNNFTVDGSDNNDKDIGVRRQGFVALVPQSAESIQEVQIITAGFSAEFGQNAGSMVNAISRSGQQQLHGSLYGLLTNQALNSRNFFDTSFSDSVNSQNLNGGQFKDTAYHHGQYGGLLGGPIHREKLFYFISGERQAYHANAVHHFVVPTRDERALRTRQGVVPISDLQTLFDDRNIPYSNVAGGDVFSLYPLPNNATGPFGLHNYSQARRSEGRGEVYSVKLDLYHSAAHSFAGRYNFTDDNSVLPFTGDAINSSLGTSTRTQNLSLFLNSVLGSYGSALRVSYGRTRLAFPADRSSPLLFGSRPSERFPASLVRTVETPYGQFGPFGSTGPIGQLTILPYSPIGVDVFNFPQGRIDNTFQVSEFVTRTGTSHTLRAGFDIRRSQLNSFVDRNSRPLLLFGYGNVSSLCVINPFCIFATPDALLHGTDLAALGAPSGFLQTISTGLAADTTIGLRLTQYDVFIQDDWKAGPGLTVNLGVRYELQSVPSEVNGRIEKTFDVDASQFGHLDVSGTAEIQQIIRAGNRRFDEAMGGLQEFIAGRKKIYESDRNNIAPRIGFAWDPSGTGRTAVRAGYSIGYDAVPGAVTSQSRNVFPTFVPVNLDLNFQTPNGVYVNNPTFFNFKPLQIPLIRPGTLNTYNLPSNAFATGLGALFAQAPPITGAPLNSNGLAFTLPEKKPSTTYAQHLVVSLDHEFEKQLQISLSYVATRGLHLLRFATPNAGLISTPVLFTSPATGLQLLDIPPAPATAGNGRPRAGLGAFTMFENSASSTYHSFQVSGDKGAGRNLRVRGSWTWSHALDDVSDPFDGRGFFSLPQDGSRLDLERASANFDARHRVTGSVLWHLPQVNGFSFLSGWNAAAVSEFQTGQPYTLNTAVDRNRDGNLTDRPNGIGRNTSKADAIAAIDAALSRTVTFADNKSVSFRMEIFNLFNSTVFGPPVRIIESPGFGQAFDTQVGARSVKLALKVSF